MQEKQYHIEQLLKEVKEKIAQNKTEKEETIYQKEYIDVLERSLIYTERFRKLWEGDDTQEEFEQKLKEKLYAYRHRFIL